MKYVKMFIAGMAFPCFVIPFLFWIASSYQKGHVLAIPFLHFIPLIWGVWNILYFTIFEKILPGNSTTKLLITGGVLGFLVASYGVFHLNIPRLLALPESITYLPLIGGPIIYAIFWVLIVQPLNRLLEVQRD